jgi:hypothetical protein
LLYLILHDNIDNKDKKKEVEELDKAIKDKYKSHSDYAKAYSFKLLVHVFICFA